MLPDVVFDQVLQDVLSVQFKVLDEMGRPGAGQRVRGKRNGDRIQHLGLILTPVQLALIHITWSCTSDFAAAALSSLIQAATC